MFDLDRFRRAQADPAGGHATALREIRAGGKESHWIWYIFPQLRGLGSSPAAREFGLDGVAEAEAYLRDEALRARLLEITAAVHARAVGPGAVPVRVLMGSSIDAKKLVSSLTLFGHVAGVLDGQGVSGCAELARMARGILAVAEAQGDPPCAFTRARL